MTRRLDRLFDRLAGALLALAAAGCATAPTRSAGPIQLDPTPLDPPPLFARGGVQGAIERALDNDPAIAMARAAAQSARVAVRAAGDWRDPELRLAYENGEETSTSYATQTRLTQSTALAPDGSPLPPVLGNATGGAAGTGQSETDGIGIGVRIFPPNPWARRAAISVAQAAWMAAEADVRALEWALACSIRARFDEWALLRRDADMARQSAVLHERLDDQIRGASAGQWSRLEQARLTRRRLCAQADAVKARNRAADIRGELLRLTGLDAEELERVATGLVPRPPTAPDAATVQAWTEQATLHRPDLVALAWRSAEAWAAWRAARAEAWPWLTHIQGSYSEVTSERGDRDVEWRTDQDPFGSDRIDSVESGRGRGARSEWQVELGLRLPLATWLGHTRTYRRAQWNEARECETLAALRAREEIRQLAEQLRERCALADDWRDASAGAVGELDGLAAALRAQPETAPEDLLALELELIESARRRLDDLREIRLLLHRLEQTTGRFLEPLDAAP